MTYYIALVSTLTLLGVGLELITSERPLRLLQYFTIQTNLMAGLFGYNYLLFSTKDATSLLFAACLWLTLTGLVFHLMLAKLYQPQGIKMLTNLLTHTLAPLAFFIVMLTLKIERPSPILWLTYPIAYCLFWLVYGHYTQFYPYWFLKPFGKYPEGMTSYTRVLMLIFTIGVSFSLLGYAIYTLF